ncbi:hypothetical protein CORC01_13176 [Colletotrichum orchidophilum]|uniref:Uncharacterized protein n=1 Tax=Colletotrichum orchidophilum TaxID=1209926 RepID=A0A1G4AQS7_9PEZI|nr:uncharacterized protein CORC01_13176 [Colletotrichum orchidophilum]OHE91527.1 hypothetical protein CORC01_13176 [Colletotrichum orchidophilum]
MDESYSIPARTTRSVKPVLHVDIWDAIFDQLALQGHHGSLASCALLNRELSELASRRLYSAQLSSPTNWGTPSTDGLWDTLSAGVPGYQGFPVTYPYLLYIRHLDLLNFLSTRGCRLFPEPRFIAQILREAAQQNPTTYQSIVAAHRITAHSPDVEYYSRNLLCELPHLAKRRDLRVMLRSLTADRWETIQPVIRAFQELESLSLVFLQGLDVFVAAIITRHLPKLTRLSVVQANDSHVSSFASFFSNLQSNQLRSFGCSLNNIRVPLLEAIPQQTCLQQLTLNFLVNPPFELHQIFELTTLTSLTLSLNFSPSRPESARFKRWAEENRSAVASWLTSCQGLRNLHLFRFPVLVPALADALPHLHLHRLHIFSTGCYEDFYKALGTQKLEYLFLAECPDRDTTNPTLGWKVRSWLTMNAVMAMPGLRDLRLHTYFPLGCQELEDIARNVPRLQTLSFVGLKGENPTWTLRALESFRHLTNLTVLGHTTFSAREVLYWVDYLQCHRRPGGFSLSLPAQDRRSWYREIRISDGVLHVVNDPATESLKEMLKFLAVYARQLIWRGNDYESDEDRMFVHLWNDIRGPAEALQLLRGSGPYPPFRGLMENMGERIA